MSFWDGFQIGARVKTARDANKQRKAESDQLKRHQDETRRIREESNRATQAMSERKFGAEQQYRADTLGERKAENIRVQTQREVGNVRSDKIFSSNERVRRSNIELNDFRLGVEKDKVATGKLTDAAIHWENTLGKYGDDTKSSKFGSESAKALAEALTHASNGRSVESAEYDPESETYELVFKNQITGDTERKTLTLDQAKSEMNQVMPSSMGLAKYNNMMAMKSRLEQESFNSVVNPTVTFTSDGKVNYTSTGYELVGGEVVSKKLRNETKTISKALEEGMDKDDIVAMTYAAESAVKMKQLDALAKKVKADAVDGESITELKERYPSIHTGVESDIRQKAMDAGILQPGWGVKKDQSNPDAFLVHRTVPSIDDPSKSTTQYDYNLSTIYTNLVRIGRTKAMGEVRRRRSALVGVDPQSIISGTFSEDEIRGEFDSIKKYERSLSYLFDNMDEKRFNALKRGDKKEVARLEKEIKDAKAGVIAKKVVKDVRGKGAGVGGKKGSTDREAVLKRNRAAVKDVGKKIGGAVRAVERSMTPTGRGVSGIGTGLTMEEKAEKSKGAIKKRKKLTDMGFSKFHIDELIKRYGEKVLTMSLKEINKLTEK